MNMQDAIEFIGLYLSDQGFSKSSSAAIQKYNRGHPFYGSSIGKHTAELIKIMEKRRRIPPKKISNYPSILNMILEPIKYDNIENIKITAIMPPLPKKQPFIKRIFPNRKKGKSNKTKT